MGEEIIPVSHPTVLSMIGTSGPVVQAVLYLLIGLSFFSWWITASKLRQFRRAKQESEEFGDIFWETRNLARLDDSSRRLEASPLSHLFASGYRELSHVAQERGGSIRAGEVEDSLHTVERALRRAELEEATRLERGVTFLATVASSAPFIGLFGTVWGIMTAFQGLSAAKSSTIQAVAPGISEALIATAIGLAAAIPAAIAYNYFAVMIRQFRESMDRFTSEFLSVARQQLAR